MECLITRVPGAAQTCVPLQTETGRSPNAQQ
jgi:hypothetical protein